MTIYRLSSEILEKISTFMAEQVGLYFPRQRWRDLEKGLRATHPELGFANISILADRLLWTDNKRVTGSIGQSYYYQ